MFDKDTAPIYACPCFIGCGFVFLGGGEGGLWIVVIWASCVFRVQFSVHFSDDKAASLNPGIHHSLK